MKTLLNKADQAIIVDILIDVALKTDSVLVAGWYSELIDKVKGLELESMPEVTNSELNDILDQLEA